MISKNRRLILLLSIVLVILLVPAIAMLLTQEVQWNIGDFGVAGGLLLITALALEWILRKVKNRSKGILLIAIVLLIVALLCLELAVGIFGSPFAGN